LIILYSTGCPKCHVLETKLNKKGVEYTICSDVDVMIEHNILSAPVLEIDGQKFTFNDAVKWVNEQ